MVDIHAVERVLPWIRLNDDRLRVIRGHDRLRIVKQQRIVGRRSVGLVERKDESLIAGAALYRAVHAEQQLPCSAGLDRCDAARFINQLIGLVNRPVWPLL